LGTGKKDVAPLQSVFNLPRLLAYSRSDPTSFECILPDNPTKGSRPDRVLANSDVALTLKTSKKVGSGRLIWDKQKTVLAFEVSSVIYTLSDKKAKKISHEYLETLKNKAEKIPVGEANARAAQMLAEMFGIVCHPEYYQQGDQTVYLHLSSLT
jgi:hypothetical protein